MLALATPTLKINEMSHGVASKDLNKAFEGSDGCHSRIQMLFVWKNIEGTLYRRSVGKILIQPETSTYYRADLTDEHSLTQMGLHFRVKCTTQKLAN